MKVAVWDTYITKQDSSVMHFDIIALAAIKDPQIIYDFGRQYLKTKGLDSLQLSSKECIFCHIETVNPKWADAIEEKGYYIYEMENCN